MRVFITGLTGTLGTALAQFHIERGDTVRGCARSEARAVLWREHVLEKFRWEPGLYLMDCCELAKQRTRHLLDGVDILYHCAAMKHVDLCEKQPAEAWRQNVGRTEIVANVCREAGMRFVFISSDKACMAQSVYGATKLVGERIATSSPNGCAFRFGNLISSSGSVFNLWRNAIARGERVKLTDPAMTRYFIPVRQAAAFAGMWACSTDRQLWAPVQMKAACMGHLAQHIAGDKVDIVGVRPGETRHQHLFTPEENLGVALSSETAHRWDASDLLREAGFESDACHALPQ